MSKTFVKYIAYLQILGILLVVLGHSFHEYPDGAHGSSMLMYRMMYSFRMPLFLFVSGFLMVFTQFSGNDRPIDSSKFIKGKLKRLMLPFLIITLVTYIPRTLFVGLLQMTQIGIFQLEGSLTQYCMPTKCQYLFSGFFKRVFYY